VHSALNKKVNVRRTILKHFYLRAIPISLFVLIVRSVCTKVSATFEVAILLSSLSVWTAERQRVVGRTYSWALNGDETGH